MGDAFKLNTEGTGINLQILRGQQNFACWSRDFQIVAQAKGLWDVITGFESPIEQPSIDDYDFASGLNHAKIDESIAGPSTGNDTPERESKIRTESGKRRRNRKTTLGPEEVMKLQRDAADEHSGDISPIPTKPILDFQSKLALYKFNLDAFEKNQKKLNQAMALIVCWVDPTIRGRLQQYYMPHNAWLYLISQYKMSDVRALELALDRFEQITISKCKNAQDYLNELESSQQDILDAGGDCSDQAIISKMVQGLSNQYSRFVDNYHFFRDNDMAATDLNQMTSRLLTFESDLQQHGNLRSVLQVQQQFQDRKTMKCTTCNKSGHTSNRCWTTHPELKKSPEEFTAWKKEQESKRKNSNSDKRDNVRKIAAMTTLCHNDFVQHLTKAQLNSQNKRGMNAFLTSSEWTADSSQILMTESERNQLDQTEEGRGGVIDSLSDSNQVVS